MKEAVKILIVEDDKVISSFLSVMLSANAYRVIEADTGREAISITTSHCPQLILLDLGLPDISGLEVLDAVRTWSSVPVIVISAQGQEMMKAEALDRGADDYVTKPFSNIELLARIRSVLRRPHFVVSDGAEGIIHVGALTIDMTQHTVSVEGEKVHLTPIEYQIVQLLACNVGRVLTRERMLKMLWGPHYHDPQILRVNMANIRRKIERNPADPQYIQTEVGVGYRMADVEP